MENIQLDFHFLTAGFPHGAYQSQNNNQPELRGPSVRGQIRWWYNALFSDGSDSELFGTAGGKSGIRSSKIIIRVKTLKSSLASTSFIPHKGSRGGKKGAFQASSHFQLTVSDRRDGPSRLQVENLTKAIDTWLLLGGIGQRSNRAAGSLWPAGAPETVEEYTDRCRALVSDSKLSFALLPERFENEQAARHCAGDFLADQAFQSCQTPFGSARPRKPSNLKLKAVFLDGSLRLVAVWDGRFQPIDHLRRGISILADSKQIGQLLAKVSDQFA